MARASLSRRIRGLSWPADWRGQVAVFLLAYGAYSVARWLTIGDLSTAVANARWIVQAEDKLGLGIELPVQRGLSNSLVVWLMNHLYLAAQLVVVPGALVWLYRRAPLGYRRLRNTVLATWLLSIPVYALLPVAPPRLADIGLIDTITTQTGIALDSRLATSFYNPLAAVPSLHAGFALAVGLALIRWGRTPMVRALGLLWPFAVAVTVVATGNHFVLDILAGAAITLIGAGVGIAIQPGLKLTRAERRALRWPGSRDLAAR